MHFWDRHKTITCYYEILMASVCEKYDLRKLEYDILLFLYHNPKYHTAADIVRIRKLTKSHVSTALKVLEEKGFIEKETVADNKKHVNLLLTDSANELIQDGIRVQKQFAEDMLRGLTKEEIALCKQVFQKICDNAERCIKEKEQR